MEQYFSKQVSNCCQLKFSYPVFKTNQNIVIQANIGPRQINFRKKTQKKSLKRIASEHLIEVRQNPFKDHHQTQKKQLQTPFLTSEVDDYGNFVKHDKKIQISKVNKKKLINSDHHTEYRTHKSLDVKQIKNQKQQSNAMQQLMNYKHLKKDKHQIQKLASKECRQYPKIQQNSQIIYQDKNQYPHKPNQISLENSSKVVFYNPTVKPTISPMTKFRQQPMTPVRVFNSFNQKGNLVRSTSINEKYMLTASSRALPPSPININYVTNSLQFAPIPMQCTPQTIKGSQARIVDGQMQQKSGTRSPMKRSQQVSNDIFISVPPNLNSNNYVRKINTNYGNYNQSFKKIYGEVDMQDQIKHDLMRSLDIQKLQPHIQARIFGASQLNKSPPSQGSTMIPSESKFRKLNHDTQYFDNWSPNRKVLTEEHFNMVNSHAKFGNSHLDDSQQYKEDGQRREKFKSIVSVNSDEDSSESVDSIIIDKHPQQNIIFKPIKTLL